MSARAAFRSAHWTRAAWSGFRLPLEGARLLARQRRLWGLAVAPLLLSVLAFAAAVGFVMANGGELYAWATAWMPVLEAAHWSAWLWIGPAKLGLFLLGWLLFLAIAGVCLVAAYVAASLLASPFHDALSLRVERLVTGRVEDASEPGLLGSLREGARALREEVRRLLAFFAVLAPLVLAGLLLPGAQLLTGPAILVFTIVFLPLDYASYTLDRRRLSFADKRRWLSDRAPTMFGFGCAAFLTCLVPGLNLVAMPLLVVAGTLLALRYPPGGAVEAARAASPTSR